MTEPNEPTGATPPMPPIPPADPTRATQPPSGTIPPQWAAPAAAPAVPGPVVPTASLDVPVGPMTAARRPSRRRGLIDVVLVVAAIFAIGGVGFAAGRVTAPAASAAGVGRTQGAGQFQGGGQAGTGTTGGGPGGFFGGGGGAGITITGQVTELAADHLTLKLTSGQSIQIALDASTTYHSQAAATASDVTTGSTVQVQVTRGGGNGGAGSSGTGTGGTGGTGNGAGTGRFNLGAASSVTVVSK